MLANTEIARIATIAAREKLPGGAVERVTSESTADSWGDEALRLIIVLEPNATITGDAAVDALLEIQQRLQAAGESRLAIVEYATQAELDDVGLET